MRRLGGLLVVIVTVLLGRSQLAASEKEVASDYYPLKTGTQWHYRLESGGRMSQVTNQVAKIEEIDGQSLARLESLVGGKVMGSEHLSSTAQGVFRHRYNGVEVSPPICLLKYPIKEGESWEQNNKIGEQTVKMACRVGREDVEVPAGKYKTVTVLIDVEVDEMKFRTTYWYAAGIGMVKQTIDAGGRAVSLELEKFEQGQ